MPSLLSLYRQGLNRPGRRLDADALVAQGCTRSYAHVLLHRLKQEGAAVPDGPNRVRLLAPDERPSESRPPTLPPWNRTLLNRFKAKPTGLSVLPGRYGGLHPAEFLLPPSQVQPAASFLRQRYPLQVSVGRFATGENVVCLYPSKVRGAKATTEEALMHLYRHAPRHEFALALQAVLMQRTDLDWEWFRRQPEWQEVAGVFVAVNDIVGQKVFPGFRKVKAPDLTYDELATVAQAFTARGTSG